MQPHKHLQAPADTLSPSVLPPQSLPTGLANSAGFLLNRAGITIREMVSKAISPLALTPRDLGVLRIISEEGPLSQQALGKRHGIDRSTTVQVIDELEKRELVIRSQNKEDRRSYLLYLTPRGKKTMMKAARLASKEQKKFLEPLSESEWETLRLLLIKLVSYHKSHL